MSTINEKMTSIADQIRTLIGSTGAMGLDAMATNLTTANNAVASAKTAIANKDVSVPSGADVTDLAALIESISPGVTMVTGSFTIANSRTSSYTITHNAGKTLPNVVVHCRLWKYGSAAANQCAFNTAVIISGIDPLGLIGYISSPSTGAYITLTTTASATTLTTVNVNEYSMYFNTNAEYVYCMWG